MCGGGGGAAPPRKQPPPAEPPPELILDAEGAKRQKGTSDRRRKSRGRNSLVNTALAVGGSASSGASPLSGLRLGGGAGTRRR